MSKIDHSGDQHREREHFFGAVKLIAGITMLSRIAGLGRDMVLSRLLGASRVTDAFYLAFMIPNLFRRLFGEGALSAAFVPVFSDTAETGGRNRAAALFANVLGLLGLSLAILCVLIELALLAAWMRSGDNADRQLLLQYAAIMLPFMVTICLLAIGSAALNCVGHFAYPAAAPILLNLVQISASLLAWKYWHELTSQLTVVAIGVVVAGVTQLAGLIWLLRAHNLPVMPRLRPIEPGVRKIVTTAAPALLGLGVLQINAFADKLIAWVFTATPESPTMTLFGYTFDKPLEPGVVTWINYAEHLYQLPLGVLAIALGTAVFPLFSRYAARGDTASLRDSVNRALRLSFFEGFPSGIGLLLLASPLALLLFEGRRFTSGDAIQTAHVVRFYGLGMWAFCAQQILYRAFYAQKDTITPMKVACSIVGVNFVLNLILIWTPGVRHGAFGLSTSITATINVLILAYILRRRLGRIGARSLLASGARIIVASAVMAAVVWLCVSFLSRWETWKNVHVVLTAVVAGMGSFLLAARLLGAAELSELLGRIRAVSIRANEEVEAVGKTGTTFSESSERDKTL